MFFLQQRLDVYDKLIDSRCHKQVDYCKTQHTGKRSLKTIQLILNRFYKTTILYQ
jgi:hypothetical protein